MHETREQFYKCFRVHFEIEESIELIKKRLSRRPRFDVRQAFKHLDMDDMGWISRDTIKKTLHLNKFYPTENELCYLNDRFDRNGNGRISY